MMKIIQDLKSLLLQILQLIKNYLDRNKTNIKTGITTAEVNRISNLASLQENKAKLFSKDFYFSDNNGFLHSLNEIFDQEVYKFNSDNQAPLIIDCGSNYGLSILYLKKLFPKSRIIAFEPDAKIFQILNRNIINYNLKDVELHNEAVWTVDTDLNFYSEGSLGGRISNAEQNHYTVKAIDFKKYLNQKIDFLKMDIEGAENSVIFDIKDYLKNVDKLFLEYHGIVGENQNLGDILNMLSSVGFQYYIRVAGETMRYPFCGERPKIFNQQLNIFCYRN
ncbi:FkbM family methyltransferase [Chryseobacterium salivictor]|uniref:Methyltransferase FkbM domain-containing protein n=1 Tax=Chryseobacterium salivictor TaxID=2547600 RepID=A0A4P6ZFH6_9FLAO|nr:FkbM family methyltransferase [Chryseobacterium salivictor]QBO58351.1 hypothetical protein NBC122_01536 [Chryseobacterium salivictor]